MKNKLKILALLICTSMLSLPVFGSEPPKTDNKPKPMASIGDHIKIGTVIVGGGAVAIGTTVMCPQCTFAVSVLYPYLVGKYMQNRAIENNKTESKTNEK